MASALDRCELLLQALNYSGSGDWLDESGNGHDATPVGSPTFDTDHFVLNGTSQGFFIADDPLLDFAAGDSFTIMVRASQADATPTTYEALINKKGSGSVPGWGIDHGNGALNLVAVIHDGTSLVADNSANTSNDTPYVVIARRDVAADDLEAGLDGTMSASPTADTTTGTLANAVNLSIGYRNVTASQWLTGDIYAVALWREALSDAEITEASATLVTGYTPASQGNLLLLGVG